MDAFSLIRIMPSLEMLSGLFPGAQVSAAEPQRTFSIFRRFRPGTPLDQQVLYLCPAQLASQFPSGPYSVISSLPITGTANTICCPGWADGEILDSVLELFTRCREQEIALEELLFRGGSLQELCDLGTQLIGNPVYIHDDWFIMLARSSQIDDIMPPEYMMSSTAGFVPRVIVEDFKYDSEYLETYTHRDAQIWEQKGLSRCMYVNLWDGNLYRGRLLIIEANQTFRPGDEMLAQALTQRAMALLRRKQPGSDTGKSMDDTVYQLLQGTYPEPAELNQILGTLNWRTTDSFVCIRLQSQQASITSVMEHLIHTDLFRCFPECYILLSGHQQRVILNLRQQPLMLPEIRHILAPLCRDYCLYAGISSPVSGIRDLHLADYQAGESLNWAFHLRNEKWIVSFSEYALDYVVNSIHDPLQPGNLVAPELLYLKIYDREKGTEFFPTLREFLLQERDIPRTAQKLIIHRTTLLYRLKKLKSIVPINLDDPRQRLYLLLSLWILDGGWN